MVNEKFKCAQSASRRNGPCEQGSSKCVGTGESTRLVTPTYLIPIPIQYPYQQYISHSVHEDIHFFVRNYFQLIQRQIKMAPGQKSGPAHFLGLELATDQLRASIVDESLDLVGVECVDFDSELPEYQ